MIMRKDAQQLNTDSERQKVTMEVNGLFWNPPDTTPDTPGEYPASLDPQDSAPGVRRWWSGQVWSNPYFTNTPIALKEKIREQPSVFFPFWQSAEN